MPEDIYLGFDFGFKRIGVAIGQRLTFSATPLTTIHAKGGVPLWEDIAKIIATWRPQGLVVGLPTKADDSALYTTEAAKDFAKALEQRFKLPVYLSDERLSTKEARARIFDQGGYRSLKKEAIDSIAACVILEQWLQSN